MKELRNLLPDTADVLKKLADLKLLQDFTFVGGSALTVYLNHRYSEDIDLFSWKKSLDTQEIIKELEKNDFQKIRTLNLSETQADFVIDGVKITFFANNWEELKKREHLFENLFIAKLDVLAAMKVNTLFLRAKYRDYYDLYVLNKTHYTTEKLFELANEKIPNLNLSLFQKALVFTADIEDESIEHLKPKYKVGLKQIEEYFVKQIKLMNKNINN